MDKSEVSLNVSLGGYKFIGECTEHILSDMYYRTCGSFYQESLLKIKKRDMRMYGLPVN